MSLLNIETKPTTKIVSTADNAPLIAASSGDGISVLKACLATGFGAGQDATLSLGWTVEFEDIQNGKLVLKAGASPDYDIYLRLSEDNGEKLKIQIFTAMTDVDTGTGEMSFGNKYFYYRPRFNYGRWIVVGNDRGFFVSCEGGSNYSIQGHGSFLYLGDTSQNLIGQKSIACVFSKATSNPSISHPNNRVTIKNIIKSTVHTLHPRSLFDGTKIFTDDIILCPIHLVDNKQLCSLPGIYASSNGISDTYVEHSIYNSGIDADFIAITNGLRANTGTTFISLEPWEY